MNFELLPNVMLWIAAIAAVTTLGLVLVAGLAVDFVARNRPVRLRRNESVRRYYGHVSLSH
jgi:putative effector of murein hydrolase LrgA (UPF0299 family)